MLLSLVEAGHTLGMVIIIQQSYFVLYDTLEEMIHNTGNLEESYNHQSRVNLQHCLL